MLEHLKQNKLEYVFLLFILALALSVRMVNIEGAPGGVYPDEAVNGMDAYKAYAGEQEMKWFYPDNNGREGLYINLIALTYPLFGVSVFGLKFWSIIFGVLTVLGTYFLAKELFRSRRAALVAAFLIAVSFWSINFSRIAFRAIVLAPVLLFSIYFLFVGLRTKRWLPFAVGGFIFGIGLHTYIAFRIAPAILIALFVAAWLSRTRFIQTYWKHTVIFIAFSVLSALPMLWTFYEHPEFIRSRTGNVSVFSPEVNGGKPFLTLAKSLGLSFVKYNFVGDMNWRHNYPPYPVLNPVIGISFLIGCVMLLKQFFHLLYKRLKRGERDTRLEAAVLLLAWFFVMHAPEFLTAEGLPHALRAIGALPAVYLIATLPFIWLLTSGRTAHADPEKAGMLSRHSWRCDRFSKIATHLFVFSLLLFVGVFNIVKYHVFWANEGAQHRSFESNLMEISRYIHALPQDTPVYFVAGSMQRIPVKLFNADRENLIDLYPQQGLETVYPKNAVIILTEPNDILAGYIETQFDAITAQTIHTPPHDAFFVIIRSGK